MCLKCNFQLLDQEDMDKHNAKEHANDLSCLNCGIMFETLEMLNDHLEECLGEPDEIIKEALEAITEEEIERAKLRKVLNPRENMPITCGKCDNCLKEPCGKCTLCQKRKDSRNKKETPANKQTLQETKAFICVLKMCEEQLEKRRNEWKKMQTIKFKKTGKEFGVYKSFQCRRCVYGTKMEEKYYKWNSPHTLRLHYAEKHS